MKRQLPLLLQYLSTLFFLLTITTASSSSPKSSPPSGKIVSNVGGGTLKCPKPIKPNPKDFMTPSDAQAAIEQFCNFASGEFSAQSGNIQSILYEIPHPTESKTTTPIFVSAWWTGGSKKCPSLKIGSSKGYETCKERLKIPMDDCDKNRRTSKPYWKQGGNYTKDCMTWILAPTRSHGNFTFINQSLSAGNTVRPVTSFLSLALLVVSSFMLFV